MKEKKSSECRNNKTLIYKLVKLYVVDSEFTAWRFKVVTDIHSEGGNDIVRKRMFESFVQLRRWAMFYQIDVNYDNNDGNDNNNDDDDVK